MAVERLEIHRSEPYEPGRRFGDSGSYLRIDAVAHYRVDPAASQNQCITDLNNAITEPDGSVVFSGDVTILLPQDASKANGALLVEVPNRGSRIALRAFNMAPSDILSTANMHPGDGFLLERGWCVAWCGWQWDVPRSRERVGLAPPLVDPRKLGDPAKMQLRIQPDMRRNSLRLTDQHVGAIGNHRLVLAADPKDPKARLLVRDRLDATPTEIARTAWRFARDEDGAPVEDAGHVWLGGGFAAGRIYDVLYTPLECPVVGAGLLAVRDLGAFLKRDSASPTKDFANYSIVEGQSQCGRFLRAFLGLGQNVDESGLPVYDGVLAHIAGGRRGEFNHRYAQPSVQPTPSFGHLFPFADNAQTDPLTGVRAGLLDRQREVGGLPKIFYTDTSSEYYRGDAALSHINLETQSDAELPGEVRRYLFASTQHGPGGLPFARLSIFGTRAANDFNVVDYRPLYRAALQNLLSWVKGTDEPPPSVYPRIGDGSAIRRAAGIESACDIAGLKSPDIQALPGMRPVDLGPRQNEGIGEFPASFTGPAYPDWVSALDENGNETAGIQMPDVTVPVGTHTGFNTRDPRTGGKGHYLEYLGSSAGFAPTEAQRTNTADQRPSIEARYASREDYLARVRHAASELVEQRYLLADDVEICVQLAAQRYDACMQG